MARRPYGQHRGKGKAGRHVQLQEWFQASDAWATLKPGPRALYIEMKRRYNGGNNGCITLSHREAARALAVNRNTVGPWFCELQARGFIRMHQGPHLGPSGIGLTALWELTELQVDVGTPAAKDFMRWRQKQHPRPKNRTPRPENLDGQPSGAVRASPAVLKIVTNDGK